MSLSASLAGRGAWQVQTNARSIRELQRIGPQPWLYVGDYPADPFTRPESPAFQNDLTFRPGRRIRFRWGFDGSVDADGSFDLTDGYVSGDVGLNINENTDEFEGEGFEVFIPLELDVGVWSAAACVLYAEDEAPYVAGDLVIYYPIVADPIP